MRRRCSHCVAFDRRLPGSPRRLGKDADLSLVISWSYGTTASGSTTPGTSATSARRYATCWPRGHRQAHGRAAECMLVLIGATPEDKKELSASNWSAEERTELARSFSSTSSSVAPDRAGPRGRDCAPASGRRSTGRPDQLQTSAAWGSQDRRVLDKVASSVLVNTKVYFADLRRTKPARWLRKRSSR